MYKFFMGPVLLPVTPAELKIGIQNKDKTIELINEGEVSVLKKAGLTKVEFKVLLPHFRYPFVINYKPISYFLNYFEKLKNNMKPFSFIVVRPKSFGTNLQVTLESYDISESAANGKDLVVTIKLRQYRPYGLKRITLPTKKPVEATPKPKPKAVPKPKPQREGEPKKASQKTYTVVRGDCLWTIARRFYGDGSQWRKIYNANSGKISNPDLIYPGQVFVIP